MQHSESGRKTVAQSAAYRRAFLGALLVFLLASRVCAVEVSRLEITSGKDAYSIEMSLRVSAPAQRVMSVLTDFSFPDPVNPDVTHKEVIAVLGDVTRVRTEFKGCVLFICRDVELIQDVRISENEIFADILPDSKSFRSGRLHWRITDAGDAAANIEFSASMVHNFFVMPLVGGFILRKRIRDNLLESVENLEKAASR